MAWSRKVDCWQAVLGEVLKSNMGDAIATIQQLLNEKFCSRLNSPAPSLPALPLLPPSLFPHRLEETFFFYPYFPPPYNHTILTALPTLPLPPACVYSTVRLLISAGKKY
jgi:hypothetical protein